MIVNMYDQEASTRIMADHEFTNTYDKKYAKAISLQEATKFQDELLGKASVSHKRSDYKSQQAAKSREQGRVAEKLDENSKGKCSDYKQPFKDVIMVRGQPIKIKKCQACFDISSKCSKCNEMGHTT